MHDYFAFGGCLRSEVEFPDLSPALEVDAPDWEVRAFSSVPTEPATFTGERVLDPNWALRLYRLRQGWRLEYGATGSYEVLDGGRRILWYQGSDRREEVIRAVILGPIMALALHESGTLCLHGSAVTVGERGIGFLAPKGYGKSTLAVALTAAGGRLMSDDLLAVTPTPDPQMLPGVHSVRMRDDVTELMADAFPGAFLQGGSKKTLTNLPPHLLGWTRVALDSLYLISPVDGKDEEAGVRRTRVEPMEATLSLAKHTKITDLLGNLEAGTMLPWIVEVVSRVPVYALEVPRDLRRLTSVAEHILGWHDGPTLQDGDVGR